MTGYPNDQSNGAGAIPVWVAAQPTPTGGLPAWTELAGALTNNTVAIPKPTGGLIIGNPSDTAMFYRVNGTASGTAGIPIPPGGALAFNGANLPRAAGTLFCAGAAKSYTVYYW